jgi:predicted small metal-binding protein
MASADVVYMKQFACQSVVKDCDAVFTGESEGEVLLQAVRHATEQHDMNEAPAQAAVLVFEHIVDARPS